MSGGLYFILFVFVKRIFALYWVEISSFIFEDIFVSAEVSTFVDGIVTSSLFKASSVGIIIMPRKKPPKRITRHTQRLYDAFFLFNSLYTRGLTKTAVSRKIIPLASIPTVAKPTSASKSIITEAPQNSISTAILARLDLSLKPASLSRLSFRFNSLY